MKEIYFLRHAKSSWNDRSIGDFHRPLTSRGINDSINLSKYIQNNGIYVDHIYSSPSYRTRETLDHIADSITTSNTKITFKEGIYSCTNNYLIDFIRSCSEADKKIMFVGHNPALHLVFEQLSQLKINQYPTCSFSGFLLSTNWDKITPEKCKLKLSVKPKDLINEN